MKLSEAVSKNRAEEFPDDLWGLYVLPLDYDICNLHKLTKGAVIEGGRGSGKTMFLKYHCHATMFSRNRTHTPESLLSHIGIYWKPDTSFTQLVNERWLGESYSSAFNTYASLCILSEICKMCKSIAMSNIQNEELKYRISNIHIPQPLATDLKIERKSFIDSIEDIRGALYKLTNWINLPDSDKPPYGLAIKSTMDLVLSPLRDLTPELQSTTFHILIDEFENLSTKQQEIINTCLKHSDKNLIFSIAFKKGANVSNKTLSQEKIVDRNDYRRIDLESVYLNESNAKLYEVLASEILALKAFEAKRHESNQDVHTIRNYSNPDFLKIRKKEKYQERIRENVKGLFESASQSEVSKKIINDPILLNKLKDGLIKEGLKKYGSTNFIPDDFIDSRFPEASIVNGALLNRSSTSVEKIKLEFEKLKVGDKNQYQTSGWINNNLFGVILYIYNAFPKRVCPLYVGFNQFILMSKGNIRHFLELCYQTFTRAEAESNSEDFEVPIGLTIQGKATRATSTAQLEKIEELGSNGIHLKRLAKRLGLIFLLSQKRRSQSEPEVNHFTIAASDISALDDETKKLLDEALVWSVLFSTKGTKAKSVNDVEMVDYILHPVLACHFGISHRKKRKVKFNTDEMRTICYGQEDEFRGLTNRFVKQWDLEIPPSGSDKSLNMESKSLQYSLL